MKRILLFMTVLMMIFMSGCKENNFKNFRVTELNSEEKLAVYTTDSSNVMHAYRVSDNEIIVFPTKVNSVYISPNGEKITAVETPAPLKFEAIDSFGTFFIGLLIGILLCLFLGLILFTLD